MAIKKRRLTFVEPPSLKAGFTSIKCEDHGSNPRITEFPAHLFSLREITRRDPPIFAASIGKRDPAEVRGAQRPGQKHGKNYRPECRERWTRRSIAQRRSTSHGYRAAAAGGPLQLQTADTGLCPLLRRVVGAIGSDRRVFLAEHFQRAAEAIMRRRDAATWSL